MYVLQTKGFSWQVPTGRRDGRVSVASEALTLLPRFDESMDSQKQKFSAKGLNTQDLVALVGNDSTHTCHSYLIQNL